MTPHGTHTSQTGETTIFCPECGEILESLTVLVRAQQQEIADLQNELSKKIGQINRLKGDRLAKFRGRKDYGKAMDVLGYWKKTCMPSARELEGGGRLENVLGRLIHFDVDQLKRAADGYALKPYVVNGRRQAVGRADEWRADAELVYRDPQHVHAGLAILEAHEAMQKTLAVDDAPTVSSPSPTRTLTLGQKIALYCTEMNFAVFPCLPDQKLPATRHGFQDATTDPARITACWENKPNLNVAIATGRPSSVIVVDVDVHKGGDESLTELEKRHGAFPPTLSSVTPRGGQHLYFAWPGRSVPNAVDIVPGIDIRGDGGYVLVPPSRVDGKAYEWDERRQPAEMPQWLLNGLQRRSRQVKSASYWINLATGVIEGQRNTRLTELVGLMVGHGLPDDLVATLALAVNQRFQPPLGDREVATIVRSIIGRHQRRTN